MAKFELMKCEDIKCMICFEIFWQFYFLIKIFETIQEMHCWLGVDFFWLQVQSKTVLFDVYLKHGNYKSVIVDKIILISSLTMNELLRNFIFYTIYFLIIFCTDYKTTYRLIKCIVYVIFEYLIVILPLIMDIEIFTWSLCKKAKN